MQLADCKPNDIVNLTPGLIPIMGDAWKVGDIVGYERIVHPVVWRDDKWVHDLNKRPLYLDGCTEVVVREN